MTIMKHNTDCFVPIFRGFYFVFLSGASSQCVPLESKYYLTGQKSLPGFQLSMPCHTSSIRQSLLTHTCSPSFIPRIINPHVITGVSRQFAVSNKSWQAGEERRSVIIGTAGLRPCGVRPQSFFFIAIASRRFKLCLQHVRRAFSHQHKRGELRLHNEIILFWPSSSKVFFFFLSKVLSQPS